MVLGQCQPHHALSAAQWGSPTSRFPGHVRTGHVLSPVGKWKRLRLLARGYSCSCPCLCAVTEEVTPLQEPPRVPVAPQHSPGSEQLPEELRLTSGELVSLRTSSLPPSAGCESESSESFSSSSSWIGDEGDRSVLQQEEGRLQGASTVLLACSGVTAEAAPTPAPSPAQHAPHQQ